MRWAEWFVRRSSPSARPARRRARLAIQPLEDRTVPHGAGADHVDHPPEPTPEVEVIKEEVPPAPDDAIIHLDDHVIEPGDGQVTDEDKVPPEDLIEGEPEPLPADGDPVPLPEADNEILMTMSEMSPQAPKPNAPLPQIGDRVWRDTNANGLQDPGEPGLGFVTLQLYQGNTLVATTMTDGLGGYAFNQWNVHNGTSDPADNGLKANTAYQIRVAADQPALAGLRPTQTNTGTGNADEQRDSDAAYAAAGATLDFTMGTDEIYYHYDIGYLPAASVGNLVWNDQNNNGKRDKNEPGVSGVTVRLLDTGGTQVATTTTAADGSYKFTGLLPGSYVVEVAANNFASGGALAGASSSTGKVGQLGGPVEGTGTPDPDASSIDGDDNGTTVNGAVQCKPVTLTGADNSTVDFGFFHAASLNGRVYLDVNSNGRIDPEDTTGLAKVRIRLAGPTGTYTTTTDTNGKYQFGSLPAAIYTVTEAQPPGFRSSTANMVTTPLVPGPAATVNFGEARAVALKVGVSASRTSVGVGGTVTVTYRVRNLGTLDATGVVITAPLPAAYKFVSSNPTTGAAFDPATQRITVGTLAAGAEAKVQVKLQVTRPGTVRFKATAQAHELEDNLQNNTAGVLVTAHGAPMAPMTRWLFNQR